MAILEIEKKVFRPSQPSIYLNSIGRTPGDGLRGDLLATAELPGSITLQSTEKKLTYRDSAVVIFERSLAQEKMLQAQKMALEKVGSERNFFYRFIPDTEGNIVLRHEDYTLFSEMWPGIAGILVGSIVETKIAT